MSVAGFKGGFVPFGGADDASASIFGTSQTDALVIAPVNGESESSVMGPATEKLTQNEIDRLRDTVDTIEKKSEDVPALTNVNNVQNAINNGETHNKNELDMANLEASAIKGHEIQQLGMGGAVVLGGPLLGSIMLFESGVLDNAKESLIAGGISPERLAELKDALSAAAAPALKHIAGAMNYLQTAADGTKMIPLAPEIEVASALTPMTTGAQLAGQMIGPA